ncbi:MAG TPA: uracil-DNA glycosylase family protein [Acidimicrobiales bacterium]|nr:uracil-DNA glycosylase family protein [Acidimicrobiales bacterium]
MDVPTIEVYDRIAAAYAARRRPALAAEASAFGEQVPAGSWRADLGSGTGRYTGLLGSPVLALDASWPMLALAPAGARVQGDVEAMATSGARVQGDVEAPPLRRGALGGAWANQCYQHVRREHLPLALARLHDILRVGAPLWLSFAVPTEDDFPGRLFERWSRPDLVRVLEGAGFVVAASPSGPDVVAATRALTLPDIVRPGMRVLVCGLNPSVYSAERGVAFARPGNRFWPAALAAGLVGRDRDPWDALASHGVGFTDLVKRATPQAAALRAEEYRAGVARVGWVAAFLRPRVVCIVGLAGWRAAVDRTAVAGPQPSGLGGAPVYLMPNPSGLNAHATIESLAAHLRAAAALADA